MKKVRLFLSLLAMVFMVSACELSPGEIEPIDTLLSLEPTVAGEEPGDPLPPPPPAD